MHWNLGAPQLYQYSLAAGEAVLSADGALCADTGEFTGRSPKDKFTVRDASTEKMWWAGNQSITRTSSPRSMLISSSTPKA